MLGKEPKPTAGLWWTAVLTLMVGGVLTFVFLQDRVSPDARVAAAVTGSITVIAAGLCVIGATAQWWLKK